MGIGYGVPELLAGVCGGAFWVLVVLVGGIALLRRRGRSFVGGALVLRKFKVDEHAPDGRVIEITGRPAGPVAWILTLLQLETETTLTVGSDEITVRGSSLSGQFDRVVPLASVASTHCGYQKPIAILITGAVLVGLTLLQGLAGMIGGVGSFLSSFGSAFRGGGFDYMFSSAGAGFSALIAALFAAAFIAGVCAAIYWLWRRMFLSFETCGGEVVGIAFKPSVIEGVQVDMAKASTAVALVNKKVLEATARG